jgi:poly-gamma-glutamate synthesis protein (capsule biosynthesis protein)
MFYLSGETTVKEFNSIFTNGEISFPSLFESDAPEWTLSATGDFAPLPLLEKTIELDRFDALMENIAELVDADISITNLEVALCDDDQVDGPGVRGSRSLFEKTREAAPFSVYSLANNHILDAGPEALTKTINSFKERNINYVGAGLTSGDAYEPLILSAGGARVGILAFAQCENQIATRNSPGAAELAEDVVLSRSAELAREVDVPIVILHEGFEFMSVPRFFLRKLCGKLVDSGVKTIFAHHPHVPQGMERIGDSVIFYSLGNFLFSQPHFAPYPWTLRSFVPKLTFKGVDITRIELKTFELETDPVLFLKPVGGTVETEILDELRERSSIIQNDDLTRAETEKFFTTVLLPEFFGFIQRYGNDNDNDFTELIGKFKRQTPVRNLFEDYAAILAESRASQPRGRQ